MEDSFTVITTAATTASIKSVKFRAVVIESKLPRRYRPHGVFTWADEQETIAKRQLNEQ